MTKPTGRPKGRPRRSVMEGMGVQCRAVILCTVNTVDEIERIMQQAYDGEPLRVAVGPGLWKLAPPNWKGVKEI